MTKIKLNPVLFIENEPIDTDLIKILTFELIETDNLFLELEEEVKNILNG